LALRNVQLGDGDQILKSFDFSVDVKPAPGAISAVSAPASFKEPKFSGGTTVCDQPMPQHVPGSISEQYVREHALEPPYPQIREAKGSAAFLLVAGAGNTLLLPVLDVHGNEAYTLECDGGFGEAGLAEWGIQCKFLANGKELDLLSDSVDPYTLNYRSLFEAEQLTPACRGYPEWGTHRQFRLRNLNITLVASDDLEEDNAYKEDPGKKVALQAEITPDPAAASPVALPSQYVDWRILKRLSNCKEILTHKTDDN
jgi:hypothetical protein